MSASEIPVINVEDIFSDNRNNLDNVAAQIGSACRGLGFFCITGHGVSPELIKQVFSLSEKFFHSDLPVKEAVSIEKSIHNRGWIGLEKEQLDQNNAPDKKEAFNIGLNFSEDHPEVVAGKPFRGVNLWPDITDFQTVMLDYYNAMWKLGRQLHRAFSVDLSLSEDYFEDKLDAPLATLRLLYYPGRKGEREDLETDKQNEIGAGQHTDYGNITLLLTDGTAGLEVQSRRGEWIAPPQIDNAFICNIGDCLMRWTNDIYVSTPHRVQIPDRERYSIAFFLDPNPDATVEVLDTCVSPDRPPKYPPVSGADYLKQKLDASYEFLREESS